MQILHNIITTEVQRIRRASHVPLASLQRQSSARPGLPSLKTWRDSRRFFDHCRRDDPTRRMRTGPPPSTRASFPCFHIATAHSLKFPATSSRLTRNNRTDGEVIVRADVIQGRSVRPVERLSTAGRRERSSHGQGEGSSVRGSRYVRLRVCAALRAGWWCTIFSRCRRGEGNAASCR